MEKEVKKQEMQRAADNMRVLIAAMVERAKSGHPGGSMGGADFANVLYSSYLVYDRPCFTVCWRFPENIRSTS